MRKRNIGTVALITANVILMFMVVFLVFSLKSELIEGHNIDEGQHESQQEPASQDLQLNDETLSQEESMGNLQNEELQNEIWDKINGEQEDSVQTSATVQAGEGQNGLFANEWQGKKVAWYGDSLTELYYHCDIVDEYFDFEGYNCGIRGSNVTYFDEKSLCLSSRMTTPGIDIPSDVEVIFIMAGTNDWCNNAPLGEKRLTYDEDGHLRVDNTTFYGACHEMFNNLTLMYPDAYILVMGSPFGASNTYDIYNDLELTILDYGDALCEAASMWGIPSFNIGEMMGINVNNVEDSKALMYEGIHFVEGGARMAADVIIEEIAGRKYYK